MKATDLIKDTESAIVLFTDGRDFNRESDNKGTTGNWPINPRRKVNRVVIYHRDRFNNTSRVYLANHAGVTDSSSPGKYVIKLESIYDKGTTDKNWKEFADTGQNPVRYIAARSIGRK